MAIKTINATIQMRRGLERDFDADQMTAGEWAISTDKKYVRMCFAPGIVVRMATYEAFEKDMLEIQTILATCQDIQDAVDAMANLAEQHRDAAAASAKEADDYSKLSKSYAMGTGGEIRENDDTDSSKGYYELAKRLAQGFNGIIPMGTISFADLENPENQVPKYMFNISDAFTSDSRFNDGGGIYYGAGNNVVYTADEKWDVLAAANVTGVKGKNETTYRQGNVNITAENVGALPLSGGGIVSKNSNYIIILQNTTNTGDAGIVLRPANFSNGEIIVQSNYRKDGNQFMVASRNKDSSLINLLVLSKNSRIIYDYKTGTTKEIIVKGDDVGDCIVNEEKLSDLLSVVGLSNSLVGVQASTLKELVEKIMYSPNLRSASGNVKLSDGVIPGISGWYQFVATWQNIYNQNAYDIGLILILSCSVFTNKWYRVSIDGMNGEYVVKKVEYVEFGPDGAVAGKVNLTNNLLANVPGVSALDSAVGPVIQGEIDEINSNLSELSDGLSNLFTTATGSTQYSVAAYGATAIFIYPAIPSGYVAIGVAGFNTGSANVLAFIVSNNRVDVQNIGGSAITSTATITVLCVKKI